MANFKPRSRPGSGAFTLIEILVAIGILSLVLAAIYSTWTAILRASRVGLQAAAAIQRARIAARVLEDSLTSAECFNAHMQLHPEYYAFMLENGNEASLSFVARLSKAFPRGGKFGDLDVRRLTFSVEPGPESRQLVLRQTPLIMDMDTDERDHPLVLAQNVREFQVELWDARLGEWIDEWKQTNQLPKMVKFTLKLADSAHSTLAQEEVIRVITLSASAVAPGWQGQFPMGGRPGLPGQPGMPGGPMPAPPGVPPGGPGFVPK